MSIEEFDNTAFGYGDKAIYEGETYLIASADFEERIFGLKDMKDKDADMKHVRCESIEFISGK